MVPLTENHHAEHDRDQSAGAIKATKTTNKPSVGTTALQTMANAM